MECYVMQHVFTPCLKHVVMIGLASWLFIKSKCFFSSVDVANFFRMYAESYYGKGMTH